MLESIDGLVEMFLYVCLSLFTCHSACYSVSCYCPSSHLFSLSICHFLPLHLLVSLSPCPSAFSPPSSVSLSLWYCQPFWPLPERTIHNAHLALRMDIWVWDACRRHGGHWRVGWQAWRSSGVIVIGTHVTAAARRPWHPYRVLHVNGTGFC